MAAGGDHGDEMFLSRCRPKESIWLAMALAIANWTSVACAAELSLSYLSCLDPALPDDDRLVSVAVSDDGKFIAAASARGSTVSLWQFTSNVDRPFRCSKANAPHHESRSTHIGDLAFSPDGKSLATAASDDKVRIWDVAAPQQPIKTVPITGHPQAIAFAPDGRSLAIAAWDGSVSLCGCFNQGGCCRSPNQRMKSFGAFRL